ncbi:MAG: hypothetical protein K6E38_00220 [Fretibacterium sp.]|nr:hypothetical protein [Fretibacterium sp.]
MTFSEIDSRLLGSASAIIALARSWAEKYGFVWAYAHGKAPLCCLVGWSSPIHELRNTTSYEVVIDRLIEQCSRGDDIYSGMAR